MRLNHPVHLHSRSFVCSGRMQMISVPLRRHQPGRSRYYGYGYVTFWGLLAVSSFPFVYLHAIYK
jgi:hypothetical protein